ncbi:MAG: DUF1998 domain-containing protein, partial [bacterium]|nr:DUF1998 domain-containing protein [bacterium]
TNMYAQRRARITADEEERLRLGYVVTAHYRAGGQRCSYCVSTDGKEAFHLTLEHDGNILLLNQGQREREGDPQGFTFCGKCHRWLVGKDADEKHVSTPSQRGECSQAARSQDLVRRLWLTETIQSDLALLDVPLCPEHAEEEADSFYTTLLHTWMRSLMVAFNLDESELSGFLTLGTDEEIPYRIVIYETTVGGSGVLASLAEPGRLGMAVMRALELLHDDDAEGGCERACYDCLLSFYNQRNHKSLDRQLVLPWLRALKELAVGAVVDEDALAVLDAQCQSDLERQVLQAIHDRDLSLPDTAQEILYDSDGSPLAIADFYYQRGRIVIFVDGSPHHRDYVQAADERKRRRLKALGYRVVVVRSEEPATGLDDLATRLGKGI